MGTGLKWAAGGILGLALLAPTSAFASDDVAVDLPSPFAAVPVHTESAGAKWRHGFHDARKTWDKYFQVYPDELEGYARSNFEKVRAEPAFFLDRKIQFDLYMGKSGTFYRPFTSPFHPDAYVNYSAWGMDSNLWTKEGRSEIHPLFYIDKRRKELIDKFTHLPMYTPIHVWAEVRSKTEGLPWIEIHGYEIIPGAVLNDAILRHLELASLQLDRKHYDLASAALEEAISMELPVNVEAKAYAMLGEAYYEQRQYNKARYALVQSIMRDNHVVPNLVRLARADLRLDRASEAKDAGLAAVRLEPSNAAAHAELGLAIAMCGDIRGGYRELDFAQKLAPRGQLPEAHRNRAMIAVREGKLPLAKDELSKALLLRPTDFSLHLELGDVYLAMNALADARQEYTQAMDLSSARREPEPAYKVALVIKAQGDALAKDNKAAEAEKSYKEALGFVRQAIEKDENFTPAYGLEADLLRLLNKPEEAKQSLLKGLEANPKNTAMQDVLYEQSLATGDWQGMESATRAALELRPSAKYYSRLGNILSSRPEPDYKEAASAYEHAVGLDPASAEDWAALAHIRIHELKDYVGGTDAASRAVALNDTAANSWYDLALARLQGNDIEGAYVAAGNASRLTPSVPARTLFAHLMVEKGDYSGALELATAAAADATLAGDKARAQSVQGAALLNTGKVPEAVEAFSATDAELHGSAEFNYWYANALLRQGDFANAQDRFATAAAAGKADGTPFGARIASAAQKGIKTVAKQAKNAAKAGGTEIATQKQAEPAQQEEPTRKPMPPVVEEDGNGKSAEPVPAQVPGPR